MKKIFFVILFFSPVFVFSQVNIDKKKADIQNEINQFKKENPLIKITIKETDSTLVITKISKAKNRSEQLLLFDSSGVCKWDKISFNKDANYKKELEALLAIKKYDWLKINENQYVSKFEERLMIELPTEDQPKSINIIRMDWNKILYDLMLEK